MNVQIYPDSPALGLAAAKKAAAILNQAIRERGRARLVLSTGMSQFDTLSALLDEPVDWSKVELFHLDEYIGLPVSHPASFRRYLLDRFISKINLKSVHLVDGEGDVAAKMAQLKTDITAAPIDLGLIGIGENAHIAFNDPPADFTVDEPYIIVNLDENCKKQQVGEGWFPDIAHVPSQAISMSVRQILRCTQIISCVPHAVKATAIRKTLEQDVNNLVPATILKTHPEVWLFLDEASASGLSPDLRTRFS